MDERKQNTPSPEEEEYTGPRNQKELFYENLIEKLHITKRGMDIVLIVLAAAFFFFLLLGYLKGNGIV